MKLIDSRFYSILLLISNIFMLNILWLVCCLPVVTIFPATAAMFGVVRQWVIHKDSSVFRPFFHYFKDNFKQSLLIGLIWVVLAILFYFDYTLSLKMEVMKNIIMPILFVFGFLFIMGTTFLFPTIVNYQATTRYILKNTLLLAMIYFPITLVICIVISFIAFLVYVFPFTLLFIFSLGAYCIYFLCHFAFTRVNRAKASNQSN